MTRSIHRRRGFTLLEMVISIGLFVTVLGMTFAFYRRSLEIRDHGSTHSTQVQLARVVLATIADEIRQASGFVPGYGPGVYGIRDAVEINTVVIPDRKLTERRSIRDKQLPGQFDLQQVRYYIAWDEENVDSNGNPRSLGLVRRANRTYLRDVVFDENDPAAEQAELAWKEELYAPEIKYLEVLYFDGARWWDTWELEQGNTLPQMVRVTVGFVPELPEEQELEIVDEDFLQQEEDIEPLAEDRYSIFIRIPQADVFFGSRMSRQASAFSEASEGAGL
jgi:hypothetical protein